MAGLKITRFRTSAESAAAATGGTGTPAGGDLGGTLPGPTVTGIASYPLSGALASGITLVFDGTTWAATAPSGDLAGTWLTTTVAKVNGVAVTGSAADGRYLRASGPAAAAWGAIGQSDFPFHDEPLTDGASNVIFANGDVVVVTGVPN